MIRFVQILTLFFVFIGCVFSYAQGSRFTSEFLFLNSYRTMYDDWVANRLIILPNYQWKNSNEDVEVKLSFITWKNFYNDFPGEKSFVEENVVRPSQVSVSKYAGSWNFQAGWLAIENGETLGAHRPNYLFPRSYENYVFDPERVAKIAQPTTVVRYLYDSGAVEFFYVLKTEDFKLPKYIMNGNVRGAFPNRKFFEDSEESFRWREFWSSLGIETTFLYSRHFSRVPVYTKTKDNLGETTFWVTSQKIESASLSLNKAWEDWVLLVDTTIHRQMPFMDFQASNFKIKDLVDGALGMQYTWGEKNSLTWQWHFVDNGEKESPLYYGSVWWTQSLFKDKLELESGFYTGLNNKDSMVTAQLKFFPIENWEGNLSYARFVSRPLGFFQILENEDQLNLGIKYLY